MNSLHPAMNPRWAIVTGAYGFLGQNAVRFLSAAGYKVAGIGRRPAHAPPGLALSACLEGDVSAESLEKLGVLPEVLWHCAGSGSVGFSFQSPEKDFEKTVETTRSVLEFVRKNSPDCRIVYPSSAAVYGAVGPGPISEERALAPVSPYGEHKRVAEELCVDYAKRYGLSVAIVRMFSLYGPGLRKQLLFDAVMKVRAGENSFFGTGRETRDWLYIDDALRLMEAATGHASPDCPIVNGGSGKAITNSSVLQAVYDCLGVKSRPNFIGQSKAGDPEHYQADIRRACGWGWAPSVSLPEGMKLYLDWLQEKK